MKVGMRKRSFSKSLRARTTGKVVRKAKAAVNPFYGQSGINMIKNPKKYVKDKVYRKLTFGMPGTGLSSKKKGLFK